MKFPLWSLLTLLALSAFSQRSKVIDPKDSCIATLDVVHFEKLNATSVLIQKSPVRDLLKYIRNCKNSFKYATSYTDRGFELTVPGYLQALSFGFGDYTYSISLIDTEGLNRTITIDYDFDEHYRQFFFGEIKKGTQQATTQWIGDKEYWFFKNWEGRYAGRIFLDSTTFITYYTKDPAYEKELQQAIASFVWKP